MHKCICLPLFLEALSALEHLEGKCRLTQFLHNHVLVRSMEQVVVLQGVVVIEILSFIKGCYALLIKPRVYGLPVLGIFGVTVAVDGKLAQAFEPLRCQFIVGEQTQGCCQNIGFPPVFLGFGIAVIACGDGAIKFVVAFGLEQVVDVSLLLVGEFIPLEVSRIGHRHCPKG